MDCETKGWNNLRLISNWSVEKNWEEFWKIYGRNCRKTNQWSRSLSREGKALCQPQRIAGLYQGKVRQTEVPKEGKSGVPHQIKREMQSIDTRIWLDDGQIERVWAKIRNEQVGGYSLLVPLWRCTSSCRGDEVGHTLLHHGKDLFWWASRLSGNNEAACARVETS